MRIEIENYPIPLKLGVFPEEHVSEQDILLSLQIGVKLDRYKEGDLGTTLDYAAILDFCDKLIKGKSFRLIEDLVMLLGTAIKRNFVLVEQLTVAVEKTRFPGNVNKTARIKAVHSFP